MARRVARICLQVLGPNAGPMSEALTWAGTFHAIRAKLLREYAGQIGLDPGFTIHDREDSADLMNLIRHELGFSKTESRFPTKGTCLAVYSRAVNAEMPLDDVLCDHFPWCAGWTTQLRALLAGFVEVKQAQNIRCSAMVFWPIRRLRKDSTFCSRMSRPPSPFRLASIVCSHPMWSLMF
jgi:DNA helicase-2/ATP-dependent DNA helicase PcrA